MKFNAVWTEESSNTKAFTSDQDPPVKAEVVIVGAGYTGLNAALHLARAGVDTLVLEGGQLGNGASSRNAGMLLPGVKATLPDIARKYDLEFSRSLWQWTLDSIEYVENLTKREGIHCHLKSCGSLELAHKAKEFEKFKHRVDRLNTDYDYAMCKTVDRSSLDGEIGSKAFYGGLLDRSAKSLNPLAYLNGLIERTNEAQAKIIHNCPVRKLVRTNKRTFEIDLGKSKVHCERVVLATNGYTTWRFPHLRKKLLPVGSYMIATSPLSANVQNELSPRGRMFFDSRKILNYFRLTPDGRMAFGGRNQLIPGRDLREGAQTLQRKMIEIFPQLRNSQVTHSWSGSLAVTPDLLPHLDENEGLVEAYGYCGHGVSMASYLGWEAAQKILGKPTQSFHSRLKPCFPIPPLCDPIILTAVKNYYGLRDRYL